ncbi:RNA polymerase sigma factor [Singulisphaera rosea]
MAETSATLLERLQDRSDFVAWQRLVHVYSPLISNWLRALAVPAVDVDDLTQEVLEVLVREVSRFRHNGRTGAFRAWLRTIAVNCLRQSLRSRRPQLTGPVGSGINPWLDQLEDPSSDLSRRWDREHDAFVLQRLLDLIEPDFQPTTWRAFRMQVIDGASAETAAAELGLTINAVLIAKSRVLSCLRRNAEGFVD